MVGVGEAYGDTSRFCAQGESAQVASVVPGSFTRATPVGLRLDREEALRYLGYVGQPIDDALQQRFEELAGACERDLQPAYVYATFEVDEGQTRWLGGERDLSGVASVGASDESKPLFEDAGNESACVALAGSSLVLSGRDITQHLHAARRVVLLACTLGAASERELRKYAALGPTDALLYGAAASALVEATADAAEAAIVQAAAEQGLCVSSRFSPGYGDLPLSIQPAFLAALDATHRIGVMTTESYLLVPTKSVTAVLGLFESDAAHASARLSASSCEQSSSSVPLLCRSCGLQDCCALRKQGRTCRD